MKANLQKCLVTGGAGFIGSHLCEALLKKGYKVYCLDNLLTGSRENIKHLLDNPDFHFILHDIIKPYETEQKFQYIYHLASPASPPKYRKFAIETLLVNSQGTLNVLELTKKTNAKYLITSTSEVYGDPLVHPQDEKYFGNVNPIGIRSCYDEGKRFAEALTMEFIRKFDTDARIIRIFNTYGPKMDPFDGRVIVNFVNQAIKNEDITVYGDGKQTRSFCYVSDMVRGLILAMEKENTKGAVINLGMPHENTVNEIAEIIIKLTKSKSEIKYFDKPQDDPARRKPVIAKAQKLLGWDPQITLLDGLEKTITYFQTL